MLPNENKYKPVYAFTIIRNFAEGNGYLLYNTR